MRLIFVLLIALIMGSLPCEAILDRGIKADSMEDVILASSQDWHIAVASTPLAVWTERNETREKPLLFIPRQVKAGYRMGWVDNDQVKRYGISSILNPLVQANISALVIYGMGEEVKSLVEAAHKEGLKAFVTVTLEPPADKLTGQGLLESITLSINPALDVQVRQILERSLSSTRSLKEAHVGLTKSDLDQTSLSVDSAGNYGSLYCPVNQDVREALYNQVEEILEDYEADGVVLYNFGFQDEDYCFCDVCKEQFYQDTGMDLGKITLSSANYQRWKSWREEKLVEIVGEVRNITRELGPAELGVAIGDPMDRRQGYNYGLLADKADLMIISPASKSDVQMISRSSQTPVYVRLEDDQVEYVLSSQNVEGTVEYIEDLVSAGAGGMAFDFDVTYTPLWSELEPPLPSTHWLLQSLGGSTLGVGDVFWNCTRRINISEPAEMSREISLNWKSSPGAVLVGENYSQGLQGALLASYLNWPVLFIGADLPNQTASALSELGCTQVLVMGEPPAEVRSTLVDMNLSIEVADSGTILREMEERDQKPDYLVLTNSRDLLLLPPRPEATVKRVLVGDLMLVVEVNPSQIPSEQEMQTVRMNVTVYNRGEEKITGIQVADFFPTGRGVTLPNRLDGEANLTDPVTREPPGVLSSLLNGTLLIWSLDSLEPEESASILLEVESIFPMDDGWVRPLDSGATVNYDGFTQNVTVEETDAGLINNITYPSNMPVGTAYVSWKVEKTGNSTGVVIYSPDGRIGREFKDDCLPDKLYRVELPLDVPGKWNFRIEATNGFAYSTENYAINVSSSMDPLNLTAFSHTKVPRLSMISAQLAAARKGILVDVAVDPQKLKPANVEEDLRDLVREDELEPAYLAVVGDPGSLPFVKTGLCQNFSDISYELYRDYKVDMDEDNQSEVATGRIMGLSLYDASQMLTRTLFYDNLSGSWKDQAMVISTPASWPWSPVPLWIRDYLRAAGLEVKDLRWEEATSQRVSSSMGNGMNLVHFDHHGNEDVWALSMWSLFDSALDQGQVKQLVLSPQTTTSNGCLTSRLKGFSIRLGTSDIYIPMRLEDSIALAFIRAGSVNYLGYSSLSWIFVSDDHAKRFYQALVYENSTLGQALVKANNLYLTKTKVLKDIGPVGELDENFPVYFIYEPDAMLNQTVFTFQILGDPSFRPAIPQTPDLPYTTNISQLQDNKTGVVEYSVTPITDMATDWLYWLSLEAVNGQRMLNSPAVIVAEVSLPSDAEDVVVKEDGRLQWHDEDIQGDEKKVIWPVIRPRLGEERSFTVEYRIVPGERQVLNISAGWNLVSLYLEPKGTGFSKQLQKEPYRAIFTVSQEGWEYTLKDSDVSNVTLGEPGQGYLVDSAENFSLVLEGKPVETPYRLRLNPGWNVVGSPINRTVTLNNITVNAEHKRITYSEAVKRGMVSAFLWSYDPDGEWLPLGQNDSMEPGRAYLLEAMDDCRLEFQ